MPIRRRRSASACRVWDIYRSGRLPEVSALLEAQGAILRHNLHYLALCLVPLALILPPSILLMAQMESYYGWAGLEPGDSAVLTVTLDVRARGARPEISLEAPQGVRVETPGVWAPAVGEIPWRIRAVSEGEHELAVLFGGQRQIKTIPAGSEQMRRSPVRPGELFWDQLLYAVEPPLPEDSRILEISLTLARAELSLFGLVRLH